MVVAGCLAERQRSCLLEEVPEVDQVVGVFGREEIARVSDRIMGDLHEQRTRFPPRPDSGPGRPARLRITPRHLAYLKVSEGCDRLCTFCAIPYMRGKHVTKPIEKVVEEARELAADGVRELNLVAQDMTYYGVDLYGRPRLAELLRELEQIEEIDWLRILYNYPNYFTDELYETLATPRRIIPYLDMPLQHINDRMLRMMNRRHTRAETEAIIARLRRRCPTWCCERRSSPAFQGKPRPSSPSCSSSSRRPGSNGWGSFPTRSRPTPRRPGCRDILPRRSRPTRRERIMAAQQAIAFAFNRSLVGPDARRPDRRPGARAQAPLGRPDLRRRTRRRRPDLRPRQRATNPETWSRARSSTPRATTWSLPVPSPSRRAAAGLVPAAQETVVAAEDPGML